LLVSLVEYLDLSSKVWYWKVVVQSLGGPWITGPAQYEPLVYADAIARLTHSLQY
jgi:hypothetical protein